MQKSIYLADSLLDKASNLQTKTSLGAFFLYRLEYYIYNQLK